jgi:iron-sulfur cluster insertion protein
MLSDKAAKKIHEFLKEEPHPENLKLRVFIVGGGCAGLQYGFTFDEKTYPNDSIIQEKFSDEQSQNHSISLVFDPISFSYLSQATIDYLDDVEPPRFIVNNPNFKSTCGCGHHHPMPEDQP